MSDPGRIRAWQWVVWAVAQFFCTWGAIAAYRSMNQGDYHAGHWALTVSVPLVSVPLIYGWSLASGARAYARYQRRIPVVQPIPIPPCVTYAEVRARGTPDLGNGRRPAGSTATLYRSVPSVSRVSIRD